MPSSLDAEGSPETYNKPGSYALYQPSTPSTSTTLSTTNPTIPSAVTEQPNTGHLSIIGHFITNDVEPQSPIIYIPDHLYPFSERHSNPDYKPNGRKSGFRLIQRAHVFS